MIKNPIGRLYRSISTGLLLIATSAAIANAQALSPNPSAPLAPEIDTGTLGGAIAMLVCGVFVFIARSQTPKQSASSM